MTCKRISRQKRNPTIIHNRHYVGLNVPLHWTSLTVELFKFQILSDKSTKNHFVKMWWNTEISGQICASLLITLIIFLQVTKKVRIKKSPGHPKRSPVALCLLRESDDMFCFHCPPPIHPTPRLAVDFSLCPSSPCKFWTRDRRRNSRCYYIEDIEIYYNYFRWKWFCLLTYQKCMSANCSTLCSADKFRTASYHIW